jgi:hypothetical protein
MYYKKHLAVGRRRPYGPPLPTDRFRVLYQHLRSKYLYTLKKKWPFTKPVLTQKRFRYLQRIRNPFLVSYNTIQIFKNVSWIFVKSF